MSQPRRGKVFSRGLKGLAATASVLTMMSLLMGFSPQAPVWEAHPPIHIKNGATPTYQSGYKPSQIKHAYGLDQVTATGKGQTIAIVDAYGSPTIQSDLNTFNQQFGLPAASLTIAYPTGKSGRKDSGWALETSLDVEWAHALAPDAKILLVVAKSASTSDLVAAIDYAASHGAQVVSNSWGGSEFSSEASYDSHFQHAGVVYLASSGDNGYGTSWPAVSPYVVSVGGTTLPLDASGNRTGAETGWSGSGGGQSTYESEPSYQTSWQSSGKRGVPDVSFDADPNTGVAVYDSTLYQGQNGWFVVGGTSFSAPAWGAIYALADEGRTSPITGGVSQAYSAANSNYSGNYVDITSGSNGVSAATGYDYVTGVGSPVGQNLVPALYAAP